MPGGPGRGVGKREGGGRVERSRGGREGGEGDGEREERERERESLSHGNIDHNFFLP